MECHASSSVEGDTISRQSSIITEDYDEEQLLCGYGSCTPAWLQRYHTAKWLLVVLGICSFVQSFVVNAIFPVDLSTLEKRFHMTSTQTGIISSWYDFAVLLAVFPVCNWGNTGHKGKWIGIGSFLMGLGSFVCTLPHYLSSPYRVQEENETATDYGQCVYRDESAFVCDVAEASPSSYLNPYFLLFLLGQTFHGFGATPLFSLGTAYIDENISQKTSPLYLAINAAVTAVGPVIGLFIGGFLLNIYIDFDRVDMAKLPLKDSSDPRWLGAWWIGFLVSAIFGILTAFPILSFARELPEAKKHRAKDINQVHAVSQVDEDDVILKGNVKYLPKAVWNILRNPTFVTCIVLGIFDSIILNGFAAFMPKIIEAVLSTTPAKASYLSSVVIFAAAAGVLSGGAFIKYFSLQVGGMLKMIFVCQLLSLLLTGAFMIQCPARDFIGINLSYKNERIKGTSKDLLSTCNADCYCKMDWSPVCHQESGNAFYSPCFAGCTEKMENTTGTFWANCSCLDGLAPHDDMFGAYDNTVRQGFCEKQCGASLWVFLFLLFLCTVASFASGIPSQQIMLRVVPFQQRALGIGVHWSFLRLLGFIPGGVLFGMMIDTACLKWQESCGAKQACLVYDPYRLSWTIMAVAIVCKLVSILATVLGYMTYRPSDLDSGMSVQTTDSRGPLSLTVNDDRPPNEANNFQNKAYVNR